MQPDPLHGGGRGAKTVYKGSTAGMSVSVDDKTQISTVGQTELSESIRTVEETEAHI